MLKQIPIDNYFNGYNTEQISCVEIPIAGLAGAFSHNNYYYYCFYKAINSNWGNSQYSDFLSEPNQILNTFGLILKKHTIDNSNEFISFIKESIDQNKPILWITNYYKLLYSPHYIREDSYHYHGTIINGYYAEKNIISIKETVFGDVEAFYEITGTNSLICFYLKEYYICDIWDEINKYYKEINSPFYNTVFRLEKQTDKPLTITFEQLLYGLINCHGTDSNLMMIANFKNDNLVNLISNFNKIRKEIRDVSTYFSYQRQALYGSLEAFFRNLEIELKNAGLTHELADLNKFKDSYLYTRNNVLSILNASALRGKDIDEIKKEHFISEIEIKNNELAGLVNRWYKSLVQKCNYEQNKTKLVNFALGTQTWADSESFNCKASQAVDGKWDTWQTNLWHSDALEEEHWIKIDLNSPKSLTKFVIRHYPHRGYITSDFEIQGSNDDNTWNILASVQDNSEAITIHDVISCSYRYLRLYITKPGRIDLYARIFEFEAWGEAKE